MIIIMAVFCMNCAQPTIVPPADMTSQPCASSLLRSARRAWGRRRFRKCYQNLNRGMMVNNRLTGEPAEEALSPFLVLTVA